jgi:hypothetical protein
VSRLQVYKLDLLTTDCICLLFEFKDGSRPVQISEEWQGFADVLKQLSAAFPSTPSTWYAEAMLPPFAENRRVLYEASRPTEGTAA